MREPENTSTVTLNICGVRVSIKGRKDESDVNPSGWSIIAFTHSASIRCTRAHQSRHLRRFISAIIALCEPDGWDYQAQEQGVYHEIEDAIHTVTNQVFA